MKKNTETILQALYPAKNSAWGLPVSVIGDFLPHLTDGGKRSILHLLKQDGSITVTQVGQSSYAYCTDRGRQRVEQRFPALSARWDTWDGLWGCCVFVRALSFDQQFRYLRQLALKEGLFAVSRGVYFAPFPFSPVLMQELADRYAAATAVFTIAEWQFEREQSFVLRELGISDVLTAYSSISTEIEQLLAQLRGITTASDRQKTHIRTVFNRFWEALGQDPGFASYYDPLHRSPGSLLARLQLLTQLL